MLACRRKIFLEVGKAYFYRVFNEIFNFRRKKYL